MQQRASKRLAGCQIDTDKLVVAAPVVYAAVHGHAQTAVFIVGEAATISVPVEDGVITAAVFERLFAADPTRLKQIPAR